VRQRQELVTIHYRVLPRFRKHFPPYDGELYPELSPPNDIAYAFINFNSRRQSIDTTKFERVEIASEVPEMAETTNLIDCVGGPLAGVKRPPHEQPEAPGGSYAQGQRVHHIEGGSRTELAWYWLPCGA
jgi:hypothetical protein